MLARRLVPLILPLVLAACASTPSPARAPGERTSGTSTDRAHRSIEPQAATSTARASPQTPTAPSMPADATADDRVEWADARTLETAHFVVTSNADAGFVASCTATLESARAIFVRALPDAVVRDPRRAKVYLFDAREDFESALPGIGEDLRGYFRERSDNPDAFPDRVIATYRFDDGADARTADVLIAGAAYAFAASLRADRSLLPQQTWWKDGLVRELRDLARTGPGGEVVWESTPRRKRLEQLAEVRRNLPRGSWRLGHLFARSSPEENRGDSHGIWAPDLRQSPPDGIDDAVVLGWSLVHYLLHRGDPDARAQLQAIPPPAPVAVLRPVAVDPTLHAQGMLTSAAGGQRETLLVAPTGVSLAALTADWDAYWRAVLRE